jgi:hypothetical protein
MAGQLGRDDLVGVDPAAVGALQGADFGSLDAPGVPGDLV